jgi:site-specific recombinase XerD
VAVGSGGIQVGTPKGGDGRTVFVPHLVDLPERAGGDLLWTTPRGARLVSQNFRQRVWLGATERAGVPGARVHDLRHSACALMIRAGVHPRVVQQVMGHADISTTMRVYSTVFEDQLEEAARALEAL